MRGVYIGYMSTTYRAADEYMRQHAIISAAIEKLQATLDNMRAPDDDNAPITWGDVAHNAHIADALQRDAFLS